MENSFPRLSSEHSEIEKLYDVIVIGSGYGASIAASRCARAGQTVCVLERGKEWLPGEFPETLRDASSHMQLTYQGKKGVIGKHFYPSPTLSVGYLVRSLQSLSKKNKSGYEITT